MRPTMDLVVATTPAITMLMDPHPHMKKLGLSKQDGSSDGSDGSYSSDSDYDGSSGGIYKEGESSKQLSWW